MCTDFEVSIRLFRSLDGAPHVSRHSGDTMYDENVEMDNSTTPAACFRAASKLPSGPIGLVNADEAGKCFHSSSQHIRGPSGLLENMLTFLVINLCMLTRNPRSITWTPLSLIVPLQRKPALPRSSVVTSSSVDPLPIYGSVAQQHLS